MTLEENCRVCSARKEGELMAAPLCRACAQSLSGIDLLRLDGVWSVSSEDGEEMATLLMRMSQAADLILEECDLSIIESDTAKHEFLAMMLGGVTLLDPKGIAVLRGRVAS